MTHNRLRQNSHCLMVLRRRIDRYRIGHHRIGHNRIGLHRIGLHNRIVLLHLHHLHHLHHQIVLVLHQEHESRWKIGIKMSVNIIVTAFIEQIERIE